MGMSCDFHCLTVVVDAIVLSKLLYVSPAWFGFISVEHLNLIQKLLDKAYKWVLKRMYNATLLFSKRDCQLFKLMRSSSNCLHHLLRPVHSVSYSLRQRSHPYELLEHKYQKTKCSFIDQAIFDYFVGLICL